MDKDQYDEQAERLLPCEWLTDHGVTEDCEYADPPDVCHTCACRPAVAAALREQGQEISRLREKCNLKDDEYAQQVAFSKKMIAELRAENERLKADRDRWKENFESSPSVQGAIKRFHMQIEKNHKSRYEPSQMRLLERLANQIGNEGTLFHEICSEFKDCNYQLAELRAERDEVTTALRSELDDRFLQITRLLVESDELRAERDQLKAQLADAERMKTLYAQRLVHAGLSGAIVDICREIEMEKK